MSLTLPATGTLDSVPVIDISAFFTGGQAEKQRLAREIDEACRSVGFLVVTGHGVDKDLIRTLDAKARAFFDLPLEIKRRYVSTNPNIYRGYAGMETSALTNTLGVEHSPPDHREGFSMNRPVIDESDPYYACPEGRAVFHPNIYPTEIEGLQETLEAYYAAMTDLAGALMRLFALALDLPEHWFDDKVDKHMTNLMLSNYPDQPETPREGQLRAGAHTDYGSLTILKAEDRPGGLEVQTAGGAWAPVPIVPEAFVINLGDLMAQWTNDRWVSTMHRVVNPPRDKAVGSRRQSLIFFHQPNYDALIECPPSCLGDGPAKYAPITSGEHLFNKMRQMRDIEPSAQAAE